MGLSILLAGANAYLGLLAGMTVSASIPAAVVSMAVLRMFRKSNVLENNIVQTAASAGESLKSLVVGGAIGALFKFGEGGLGLWTQAVQGAVQVKSSILYFGSNLLPALVAVGYIVGINIAVLVFLGGALNWLVAVPIYAGNHPWPADTTALEWAGEIWSTRTRYLGVGAMIVGGLWALLRLWRSLIARIASSLRADRERRDKGAESLPRTERDAPMQWVGIALMLSVIPLFFVFKEVTGNVGVSIFMAVVMLLAGFLFSAVAAYMAGLVGSSNNPISGVTIATLLTSALLLSWLGTDSVTGPAAAILIGAVVCCACAIGGDTMQDLKAGQIVGATPYKQQIMQIVGVVAAAFVMAPILSLLLNAYGIVDPVSPDRPALAAPQATLMAAVARGVFAKDLPWMMVMIGMGIATVIIVIDLVLEIRRSAFRTPVLAVAVGIYLPLELSTPILFGGLISLAAHRWHMRRISAEAGRDPAAGGDVRLVPNGPEVTATPATGGLPSG